MTKIILFIFLELFEYLIEELHDFLTVFEKLHSVNHSNIFTCQLNSLPVHILILRYHNDTLCFCFSQETFLKNLIQVCKYASVIIFKILSTSYRNTSLSCHILVAEKADSSFYKFRFRFNIIVLLLYALLVSISWWVT